MRGVLIKIITVFSFLFLISCSEKEQPKVENNQTGVNNIATPTLHTAKVEEKMDASSYSYLKVLENNKSYWIAVPKMNVQPGETIVFSKFIEMKDFKSETLKRTFDSILFVDDARLNSNNQELTTSHSNIATPKDVNIKVEPLKDGYTVEAIYDKKSSLVNKTVKVKGIVVKVNENIMGTNWIHIQDGTGKEATHDLLITSDVAPKVGQLIIAEGKVISDKDFGSGYFYPVLLEKSKITVL